MNATQTLSASLVVLLAGSAAPAFAEPGDDPPEQPSGEVRPDDDDAPPPADGVDVPAHVSIHVLMGGAPPTPPPPPPPPKPVEAHRPTGTFSIGAGYSTDDKFTAIATISQPKLFGSDKGLSLTALVSSRRQLFLLRYDDPTLWGTQLRLRGDLYTVEQIHPGFTRQAVGGALTLSRTIAPHLDVFAGYKLEHVDVEHNDVTSVARSTGPQEPFWNGGVIGAVRAGIVYDDTNARDYPTRGTVVGTAVEIADRQLGSDIGYVKTDAWIGHHRKLGPFILHLGGSVHSISDVPMSERLHFDGSRDVRGYAPDSLGPRDEITGLATGGNLLWTAKGELELPLTTSFSVAGFMDAGGLYGNGTGERVHSAGVGVIWRSPIGPLRFDVAFPLDNNDKPRYIFGIGGVF